MLVNAAGDLAPIDVGLPFLVPLHLPLQHFLPLQLLDDLVLPDCIAAFASAFVRHGAGYGERECASE